jgi:CRP-like cAMP-binding protein
VFQVDCRDIIAMAEFLEGSLLHIGFAVAGLAYLFRDILWLRLVAVGSYLIFSVVAISRGPEVMWEFLPWYLGFTVINLGHALLLIYQRRLWKFTPEEAALHACAFPALSRQPAKRLMRQGRWKTLEPGFRLTREDHFAGCVYVVADGCVQVTLKNQPIAQLGCGQFVGEIGFIAGRPASATTIALSNEDSAGPRVLCWSVKKLRKLFEKDSDFRLAMESALGSDLARKIVDNNIAIQRRSEFATPL